VSLQVEESLKSVAVIIIVFPAVELTTALLLHWVIKEIRIILLVKAVDVLEAVLRLKTVLPWGSYVEMEFVIYRNGIIVISMLDSVVSFSSSFLERFSVDRSNWR
jgi:hypothetical protein